MPDERELETISDFLRRATDTGTPSLTIGANARRLVFDDRYGLALRRVTYDWDFAVRVSSWAGFRELAGHLQADGVFTQRAPHRFVHAGTGMLIDVVPFGELAGERETLLWPETDRVMSVAGFEAALLHAEVLTLAGQAVRVATPAWHVGLKLIAYRDRRAEKDLADIDFILENATTAFSTRVFDELGTRLGEDLDYDEAGPYLLAADLSSQASPQTRALLDGVLGDLLDDPNHFELRRQLLKSSLSGQEKVLALIVRRFLAFRRGFTQSNALGDLP